MEKIVGCHWYWKTFRFPTFSRRLVNTKKGGTLSRMKLRKNMKILPGYKTYEYYQ